MAVSTKTKAGSPQLPRPARPAVAKAQAPVTPNPRHPQFSFLHEMTSDQGPTAESKLTLDEEDQFDEFYESSSVIDSETMGRCKSWLYSMVIHLVLIIALALLTMKGNSRTTFSLEMATDDVGVMMQLEDLEFESAASEWEDAESEEDPQQQPINEEILDIPDQIDLLQDTLEEGLNFDNSLMSDSSLLARVSRDISNDILELGNGDSSFFGIQATGDVVYIVDRSGSMEGDRWHNATRELVKSIESLKPEQKFYVYLFSSRCHSMPRMARRGEMPHATQENIGRFKKWLFRQAPNGSTMPLSSVKRAIKQTPDTIFLLTDGQLYDETGEYLLKRAVLQETVSDPDNLVINTIAFHCQVGLETLIEIATSYDGTFRSVE